MSRKDDGVRGIPIETDTSFVLSVLSTRGSQKTRPSSTNAQFEWSCYAKGRDKGAHLTDMIAMSLVSPRLQEVAKRARLMFDAFVIATHIPRSSCPFWEIDCIVTVVRGQFVTCTVPESVNIFHILKITRQLICDSRRWSLLQYVDGFQ